MRPKNLPILLQRTSCYKGKELGMVTIKIGPVPKFDFILNEVLQPYAGFRTVLFTLISDG